MDYLEEAKDIISRCLFIPKECIDVDVDVGSIKTIDSLNFEILILEIENRTGSEIDPVLFLDMHSVRDLANIIMISKNEAKRTNN